MRLPEVLAEHRNLVLKAVEKHAASGHISHIGLDFHRGAADIYLMRDGQQRDHAGARTQVDHLLAGPGLRKVGQQHRVGAIVKGLFLLQDDERGAIQLLQPLALPDQSSLNPHEKLPYVENRLMTTWPRTDEQWINWSLPR